jgi:hypothetical protein
MDIPSYNFQTLSKIPRQIVLWLTDCQRSLPFTEHSPLILEESYNLYYTMTQETYYDFPFGPTISYWQTPDYERDFKNAICQMKEKPVTMQRGLKQTALKTKKYSISAFTVSFSVSASLL